MEQRARIMRRILSLTLLGLYCAMPVWAAEAIAEGHKAGLPQLDPAPVAGQLFWLVINFILVWQILARFAVPALSKIQKNRANHFDKLAEQAQNLSRQAQRNRSDALAMTDQAHKEAHDLLAKIANNLNAEANRRNHMLEESIEERIEDSMARINAARQHAQESLVDSSALLVPAILQKVTGQNIVVPDLASKARNLMGMLSPDENRLRRASS